MKTIKIYALINPQTQEIRYIGKTICTLKQRLTNHICDARKSRYINKNINWIKSLLNKGLEPQIILIDEIQDCESWEWLEQYWISQCRTWGFKLNNMTTGGDGNKNQKFSEESQRKKSNTIKEGILSGRICYKERAKKISAALKGKIVSEETKLKLRNFNLGKKESLESKLKKAKAIIQYDLQGNFIKEWDILCDAARELKIHKGAISGNCKGTQKSAGGFRWKYKQDMIQTSKKLEENNVKD